MYCSRLRGNRSCRFAIGTTKHENSIFIGIHHTPTCRVATKHENIMCHSYENSLLVAQASLPVSLYFHSLWCPPQAGMEDYYENSNRSVIASEARQSLTFLAVPHDEIASSFRYIRTPRNDSFIFMLRGADSKSA